MQYRVANPDGASIYRRKGTQLVRLEDLRIEHNQYVEATGITYNTPTDGHYVEIVHGPIQDTLDQQEERYVFSGDLDLKGRILKA